MQNTGFLINDYLLLLISISHVVKNQAKSRHYIRLVTRKYLIQNLFIGIQASSRKNDIKQLLSHELSPVPTAIFSESGEMRVANAKSKLLKVLQKEVSVRNVKKQISTVVIYGSAIFYVIPWPPSSVTVEDFVISFRNYIEKRLHSSDAYLVFDRYKEYSKKGVTRVSRGAHICCVHSLPLLCPCPSMIFCTEKCLFKIVFGQNFLCMSTNFQFFGSTF